VTRHWLARRGPGAVQCLAVLASGALGGEVAPAAAAELVLTEPAPCITADELAFRVERLLGQPLSRVEAMQLSVRIEPDRDGYAARFEVSRPGDVERGQRSLRAASCEELSESLALAIVVAIGSVTESSAPASAPVEAASVEPASVEAAPVEAAPVVPADAAEAAPSAEGPRFAASAWMIGDTGTLPAAGFGMGLGVGLTWPSVELRAIGTLLPEREGTLNATDSSSPGASIGLLAGSALVCLPVALEQTALAVALCAGGEVGQLSGSGTQVSVPYHQRTRWAAARFDVAARWAWPETPLALELLVTAAAPFRRDDFILKDLGSVHQPASVIGRLGLGLSVTMD
jgi:hypothetical protein